MFETEKAAVDAISCDAMAKVKSIIIAAAKKISRDFPMMKLGIRDNKKRPGESVDGMLDSVDVTVHATKKEMPGIVLYDAGQFWERNWIIILTPDGIFECRFVMSEAENKKEDNLIESCPDWTRRRENADLYLRYAERAFIKIADPRATPFWW